MNDVEVCQGFASEYHIVAYAEFQYARVDRDLEVFSVFFSVYY